MSRSRRLSISGAPWLVVVALTNGCATLGANSTPRGVPLEVPPAPPHAAPAPSSHDGHTKATETADAAEDAPVTSPVSAAAPPRTEDLPVTADPARSAAPNEPLQLAPAGDELADAAAVRDAVIATTQILDRIEHTALSDARQVEYETARRFLRQARRALAAGQITYAESLSEKAHTIAEALGSQ